MIKITLLVIAAILCFRAAAGQQSKGGCQGFDGKKVYLINKEGGYLTKCNNCGLSVNYADSASLHGQRGQSEAMWTLETTRVPQLKEVSCSIKADNGVYAAVDHNGWRKSANEFPVFVGARAKLNARWFMKGHGGGYFSFKSHFSQKFLSKCNDCVSGGKTPDFAFTHRDKPEGVALWKIELVDASDGPKIVSD